jgi:hypothetical protein
MKLLRYSVLALCLLASLGFATDAQATIGWAGNVWPLHNSSQVPTGPINVYAQVWKGGVTDSPGQGAGIAGTLYYQTDIVPGWVPVEMTYNTDVGNNDEYTGAVPQAALVGAAYVDVRVEFTDLTDATVYTSVNDQSGNPPPQRYFITNVLPNDVNVTFDLCLSGVETSGAVCVTGSAAVLSTWGSGVALNLVSGEEYTVTITFPAGINPNVEYKYRKDDCSTWEGTSNRVLVLPTDGTTTVALPRDTWENGPDTCTPVDAKPQTWGSLKTLYR